jgi:hypothetical protein
LHYKSNKSKLSCENSSTNHLRPKTFENISSNIFETIFVCRRGLKTVLLLWRGRSDVPSPTSKGTNNCFAVHCHLYSYLIHDRQAPQTSHSSPMFAHSVRLQSVGFLYSRRDIYRHTDIWINNCIQRNNQSSRNPMKYREDSEV